MITLAFDPSASQGFGKDGNTVPEFDVILDY
jgi:hypothetical protein